MSLISFTSKTGIFKLVIILFRHFHSEVYFCIDPVGLVETLVWCPDLLCAGFIVLTGCHTAFVYRLSCGQWDTSFHWRKTVIDKTGQGLNNIQRGASLVDLQVSSLIPRFWFPATPTSSIFSFNYTTCGLKEKKILCGLTYWISYEAWLHGMQMSFAWRNVDQGMAVLLPVLIPDACRQCLHCASAPENLDCQPDFSVLRTGWFLKSVNSPMFLGSPLGGLFYSRFPPSLPLSLPHPLSFPFP